MHAAPGRQLAAPAFSDNVSSSGAAGSTAPQFIVPTNAGLLAPGPVCQPISDPSLTGIRCTGSGPVDDPAPLRGSVTPRVVDQEKANFTVFVSNQSFENPLMPITVKIDGYQVTSADFAVQPSTISFPPS